MNFDSITLRAMNKYLTLFMAIGVNVTSAPLFAGEAAPMAYTSPAWASLTNVQLNGFVAPNGLPTTAWFQWGTNATWTEVTDTVLIPPNISMKRVSIPLNSVPFGRSYECRMVASNALGTTFGPVQFFSQRCRLEVIRGNPSTWSDWAKKVPFSAISCYGDRVIGATPSGDVAAWGSYSAQTNVPPEATNVVFVSAGPNNSAVVRADGHVVVWGNNYYGQTNVPKDLTNAVAVHCGETCVALRDDGTICHWGRSITEAPADATNVVAVSAGSGHLAVLRIDGTVRAWGGIADWTQIPSDWTNIIGIACDSEATFALRADGTLTSCPTSNIPANVTNLVQISTAVGYGGVVGVRRDNSLALIPVPYSYPLRTNGFVSVGFAGIFTLGLVPEPLGKPFTLSPWSIRATSAIAAGMVSANGYPTKAWFEWGTNSLLGHATQPIECESSLGVQWITNELSNLQQGGTYLYRLVTSNALGLESGVLRRFTTGGRIVAWGLSSAISNTPPGLNTVVSADSGRDFTLALLNDGTLRCWGRNDYGLLYPPAGLTNIMAVAAGWRHGVALKSDGRVVAWGYQNLSYGAAASIPKGFSNVVAIGAGGWHSAALTKDGRVAVWAFGVNRTPLESTPYQAYNLVGIATSGDHMLALRNTGEVIAWGDNSYGQINVPSDIPDTINVPSGISDTVGIASPVWNSVTLDSAGRPRVWGSNAANQTNAPVSASNLVSVVGGWFHLLGLTADGQVVGWGTNSDFGPFTPITNGPATLPVGLTNVAAIGAGDISSLAIVPKLPPVAASLVVTGFMNAFVPIRLPQPVNYDGTNCVFRCETLPTAGRLYQYSGSGYYGSLIGAGTSVSDPLGRLFYAPPPLELGSPVASFTFRAVDGTALSQPATVAINIEMPAPPRLLPAASRFVSQTGLVGFALLFTGSTNASYNVRGSTNLIDWEVLGHAKSLSNGVYRHIDSDATNLPRRFYQVIPPQDNYVWW